MLCLVTDRHRLAPVRVSADAGVGALLEQIDDAARAGVDLIQIRERDLEAGPLAALVTRAMTLVRGTRTKILVNERVDVALVAGAHGVHLRSASMDARRVRSLAPAGFLIGRSVHGAAEAARIADEGGVDFLVLGTIFPTRSKPAGHPTLGVQVLESVTRRVAVPVLAIGGVTLDRVPAVAKAGAAGVAAIGLFQPMGLAGEDEANHLAEIVHRLRILFDTPLSSSLP
ncbi:MAG TPA: thiamine phosphate synthase [Vicinamibacterales bacterium]|nr:thiamine phosphate synthase [Vicinamibacterales bacterium]